MNTTTPIAENVNFTLERFAGSDRWELVESSQSFDVLREIAIGSRGQCRIVRTEIVDTVLGTLTFTSTVY